MTAKRIRVRFNYLKEHMDTSDYQGLPVTTNDPRVNCRDHGTKETSAWLAGKIVFWTLQLNDEDGEASEDIDLAVESGTSKADILKAARFLIARDYVEGITYRRGSLVLA